MGSSTLELTRIDVEEPLFLPAGWEVKRASAEDSPASKQLIESDETTGRVVAITGVTGIVDHVNDLIETGAYTKTLAKRRPKVCWAHDWEKPIGKVLAIEEWPPGDPRFAEVGATLNGKAWPADAGALVASMQFNMKSERGREAFLAVEFYSESDECEWSIGWQPIPAKTIRRKSDGVRVCKEVELFEVSPVLFGAAPHTRTLSVKSLRLDDAYSGAFEAKVGQAAGTPGAEDDVQHTDSTDENALHTAAMDSIDWAEVDAAINADASTPATKTLAPVEGVVLDAKAFAGELDFLTLADTTLVKAAEGGADRNRGGAEELRRWYEEGEGAAKIRWGQPGDFGRCVAIAGKHMTPDRAKGYCNLRHKGATGVYAGQEKSLGTQAAETLAKTWNPLLEVGDHAAHTEAKWYPENVDGLAGSFEQRADKLRDALTPHLRDHIGWTPRERNDDGMAIAHDDGCYVSVDGTWDDRVIATIVQWGPDRSRRTFEVPYTWTGADVVLGEPSEVEIRAIVVPTSTGDVTLSGDDLFALPALDGLDDATIAVKSALGHLVEVKAGRVLSDANGSRLRGAIEHLLAVARAAGIEITGWAETDRTSSSTDVTPTDTTAPVVDTPGTPSAVAVKTLAVADLLPDFLR